VSSKHHEMQSIIRQYRDESGETDVDMKRVAQFAADMGWPLSQPADPIELLAKEFSRAAREEIKKDAVTGKPYRVNHAIPAPAGQLRLWIDIDHAPRPKILRSLINRREQMVGDGLQLSFDVDHWNSVNPNEEPIVIPLDLTDDVEWRKNAPDEEEEIAS
jgi:hypothetical protein